MIRIEHFRYMSIVYETKSRAIGASLWSHGLVKLVKLDGFCIQTDAVLISLPLSWFSNPSQIAK